MPTVLDWNPTVDPAEVVRVVRETIAAGSVVVLPGDCGYVALVNPAAPGAAAHLAAWAPQSSPAILAWGADDPIGLGLPVGVVGRRLMFRGWPAPLVIVVPGKPQWPSGWDPAIRERLAAGGVLRFRCPDHPLFEAVIPVLEYPVIAIDTYLPTVEAALDALDDAGALAVSVGEQPLPGKATAITLTESGYELTEAGRFPAEEIERFAARLVLFVCTGNTCRSPLAEGLAKKLLAERLACAEEELPRRGLWFFSAGVAAHAGGPASEEAVAVAAEFGVDLRGHESRHLNPQLLAAADEVITMTRGHANALSSRYAGIGPPPRLLCGDTDLDDPIAAGLDVYRDCARTILNQLERFIPEWIKR